MLARCVEQGHPLGFATFTMRHDRVQKLGALWAAGQKGWQRAISGRGWVEVEQLVEGWVRVWEVTQGRNGWHVHVHLVVVLAEGAGAEDLEAIAGGMFSRWSKGLVAAGLEAPRRIGQDWHIVEGSNASEELGEYLSKLADGANGDGLGLELTHSMPGRSSSALRTRPVWSLLDDLVRDGEAVSLARWHEWEKASKGKHQVGWSKGLREKFAPEIEELADEEVVDQELGTVDDDVVRWDVGQWRELVRKPDRLVQLLEVVESGGAPAVRATLDGWGVPYTLVS